MEDKSEKLSVNEQTASSRDPGADQPFEETGAGGAAPAAPEAPKTELPADLPAAYRKLEEEKKLLYDRLLRKQAELENFRKRVLREKEDFLQHATADLIRALLPVLDGFERALQHRNPTVSAEFYEGVELIYRNLLDVLRRAGLTPIETEGKLFDPHLHQAVETVKEPGYRDQEIVEELQRGYKLKHRLLRPAVVKVAVAAKTESRESNS